MSDGQRTSIIKERGFKAVVDETTRKMQELYTADATPWVIGYSGGKDSSAVTQLVWQMLAGMPAEERTKPVHVISTDTLVENPLVSRWVEKSHRKMREAAETEGLPIYPHLLKPEISETYWVNIIGKGYPAPRNKFRWCTDRLKIRPSNRFIRDVISKHGEAIMVMGMRKAESATRAAVMNQYDAKRVRDDLKPSASLANALIYTPIDDWTNDDVWLYLMQVKNPWGHSNKELMSMYRGASADNECPLVIDTSTPSCGNSRFGCWVCTLVEQDKSMGAMITNDAENEWMRPLLDFRNDIDFRGEKQREQDRQRRDFRRMNGSVTVNDSGPIPGPYTQQAREEFLRRVLQLQKHTTERAPDEMKNVTIITMDELQEIRRIWVDEKREIEDRLPVIYEEEIGQSFPDSHRGPASSLPSELLEVIREESADDELHYEMLRNLLSVEQEYSGKVRRPGIMNQIGDVLGRSGHNTADSAITTAASRHELHKAATEEDVNNLDPETVKQRIRAFQEGRADEV